jgi:hypothetical protein
MLIEIAQIMPPDGMVTYVLQGLHEPPGPISDVFMGVLPFVGILRAEPAPGHRLSLFRALDREVTGQPVTEEPSCTT